MSKFLFDEGKKRDVEQEDIDMLVGEFLKADSREKLGNLLRGLLTPKEIDEFAKRIRLVRLLKKGLAQHDIAGKLGMGVATVSRGAREIKMGNFKTI